jgi:ribosomal protein S12 methylthiotransferase accessory factor
MGIAASDTSRFSDVVNTSKGGGGGERLENALAASLGEAVERYCMFFYDKEQMVFAPYREIQQDAVSPEQVRLYSREQVEALGPDTRARYLEEDTPVRWVWGTSLTDQRPRLVPASFVYMGYKYDDDEPPIGRNASTGLAAGLTIEEAILTALYEVIERDAFTLCWLQQRPGRRIEVDDEVLDTLLRRRFHKGHPKVDLQIYDITTDVPVFSAFVVMRRPTEFGVATCVGSTTRLVPGQAVHKCLIEAGQAIPYFRFLLAQLADWEPRADFSDVSSFDHHCVFYLKRPELVPDAFAFLKASADPVRLSSIPDRSTGSVRGDIERCVALLQQSGLEVIVVEITTPDALDVGLRVVRVVVPGMVPLHGVHRFPFLGSKRLYDLPQKLGESKPGPGGDAGLNPYPHPFP